MSSRFIENTQIELVREIPNRGDYQAVLFDFDGTISLLRRSWQQVMIPMMVEILQRTETQESEDELYQLVEDFVMRLNGKQTIYQMIELAEQVKHRGKKPLEPLIYKNQYHDLLWHQVSERIENLKQNQVTIEQMTVPGVHAAIEALLKSGLKLFLASGTDLKYVREEARLLRVSDFFGENIYAALDDYKNFSKAKVIQMIIQQSGYTGEKILGFGDGFVEIEEVKKVGGTAIGIASNEETRAGINLWKRTRLIEAGADLIMADYREFPQLLNWLSLPDN